MCKQNSVAKYMCATVGDPQPVARKGARGGARGLKRRGVKRDISM